MVKRCRTIPLPLETDSRGSLAHIEENIDVPFEIRRAFYIYDVPSRDTVRGEHAHRDTEQLFVAIHGTFELTIKDGHESDEFVLDDPATGVYVPTEIWTELSEFSEDAVVLVLASTSYDPDGYINDYKKLIN